MSLKAIAKELGLSVTTVSRALNGYDDVSAETRARVEAEAQRRGAASDSSRFVPGSTEWFAAVQP